MKFPQTDGVNCLLGIDQKIITAMDLKPRTELTKCETTVYAIQREMIYSKIAEIRRGLKKPVYHGKLKEMDMFELCEEAYYFILEESKLEALYLRKNLDALSSNGFLFYWDWESLTTWHDKREYDSREDEVQREMAMPKPISISSKLGSIFIIFMTGLSVAASMILVELTFFMV